MLKIVDRSLTNIAIMSTVVLIAGAPFAAAGQNGLVLDGGTLRVITVTRPAAGYFTLTNAGNQTRVLVGATSPACKKAMLHQSKMDNGVMKMLPVKELPIAAGAALEFAPGGYHVMCMHPAQDIKTKAEVPVTLLFKNGDTLTEHFVVKGVR